MEFWLRMRFDHPTYLLYYYSHESIDPRLLPPLLSKEDWRVTQRFQAGGGLSSIEGFGDWRKNATLVIVRHYFWCNRGFLYNREKMIWWNLGKPVGGISLAEFKSVTWCTYGWYDKNDRSWSWCEENMLFWHSWGIHLSWLLLF